MSNKEHDFLASFEEKSSRNIFDEETNFHTVFFSKIKNINFSKTEFTNFPIESDWGSSKSNIYRFIYNQIRNTRSQVFERYITENKISESKRENFTEDDLSDYVITGDGLINENWKSTISIPSQVIEVNNDFVILECLIDYEKKELELRKFKRSLFEDKFLLKSKSIIVLKIFEKPGKLQIEFEDGRNLGLEKYFDENYYLDNLDSVNTGQYIK